MHDDNTNSFDTEPMVFMGLHPDGSFSLAEASSDPDEAAFAISEVIGGGTTRVTMPGVDAYISQLHQLDPDLKHNPYASHLVQVATGTTDTVSGPIVFIGRNVDGVDTGISLWLVSELLKFVHLMNTQVLA